MAIKDLLREIADKLPPEASIEDAMEHLLVLAKVERGVAEANAGRTVSHDEIGRQRVPRHRG